MNWDAIFSFTNIVALLGHMMLAVWTRTPRTFSIVLNLAIGLLCLTYAILFVLLVSNLVDPGKVPGAADPNLLDYSIAGLRPLFLSDAGIVIGWTHYLAFDLFVARWIARDADATGLGRIAQLPFLFATLMAGPLGLLAWLIFRQTRSRSDD
ncbi:MAG: DUF4281 domain-containing protein [Sphingomonas bacterium]|nr:DUF4281 domain-containing protein [Sphingomonas bacterium]